MDKSSKMKELALALDKYKKDNGVSNRSLAGTIGCSEGTIRNYLKAEGNPEDDMLFKIKRKLGIVIEGLTPEYEPDPWAAQKSRTSDLMAANSVGENPAEYGANRIVNVPEFDIHASMGALGEMDEGAVSEVWPIAQKLLVRNGVEPSMAALVPVVGNSMHNTLSSGDIVLVDRSPVQRLSGRVYVIWSSKGGLQAKRLRLSADGTQIEIISDNPNKDIYPTETFDETQFHELFEVQGTVIKALFKDIPTI